MAKAASVKPPSKPEPTSAAPPERKSPVLDVVMRPTASLIPYARNARLHSDDQVKQIAESISRFGWTMPVLVDERGEIIAGHGRVLAAARLGIGEAPVATALGWTEDEKKAYRIADNAIPLNATWDQEALRLDLRELKLADFPMALTGLTGVQLVSFMAGGKQGADPEQTPPAAPVPITRAGEIWKLGRHRVICGDATDPAVVEQVLAGQRPNVMVTDPPYGVNYDPTWRSGIAGQFADVRARGAVSNDDRADWTPAWKLFSGNVAYVWHGSMLTPEVTYSLEAAGFERRTLINWVKPAFAISRGDYHWQHEPCWYMVRKGKPGGFVGDRSQSSVWQIAGRNPMGRGQVSQENEFTGHGTQKPVECMARPMRNNSAPGDPIYDPFVGSGTTVIAAQMEGRVCLAIDLDPVYVDMTVRRWQEFTGEQAVLAGASRTFAEVAAERTRPDQLEREAAAASS